MRASQPRGVVDGQPLVSQSHARPSRPARVEVTARPIATDCQRDALPPRAPPTVDAPRHAARSALTRRCKRRERFAAAYAAHGQQRQRPYQAERRPDGQPRPRTIRSGPRAAARRRPTRSTRSSPVRSRAERRTRRPPPSPGSAAASPRRPAAATTAAGPPARRSMPPRRTRAPPTTSSTARAGESCRRQRRAKRPASTPTAAPPAVEPSTYHAVVRPHRRRRPRSPSGVMLVSIDSPQGDHVERTAATAATASPASRTADATPAGLLRIRIQARMAGQDAGGGQFAVDAVGPVTPVHRRSRRIRPARGGPRCHRTACPSSAAHLLPGACRNLHR